MKVLLIEDSERLRRSLGTALKKSGYAFDSSSDGEEGLWLAKHNDYDVIILDIMLPKTDGLTVLQKLRSEGRKSHVIMLTAKDTVDDRVRGLNLGADDYLVKPFALDELLARVQALCRRSYGTKSAVIMAGGLEIDTAAHGVSFNGKPVDLTPREYRLIEYLAMRRGEVVSRAEIETHIYDDQAEPMSNVVDSAICELRKKVGASTIRTRRGFGYVLEEG